MNTVPRVAQFPEPTEYASAYTANRGYRASGVMTAAVPEMTLCVVSRQGAVFWQFDFQAASMDAASISKIGIPSCMDTRGGIRRISKLGGFSFNTSGFLQAGAN